MTPRSVRGTQEDGNKSRAVRRDSESGQTSAPLDGPAPPPNASHDPTADPTPNPTELDKMAASFGPAIYRVALSVVRDPALAEDVTQDTLLRAWLNLASYRGDAPLRNWVLRIAHNTAVSALRQRRDQVIDPATMPESAATGGSSDVERNVAGRMMMGELWQALDRLDQTTRAIVVLREVEGLTYEDIAATLDLPLPTVRTRLFRARRQLAGALEGWQR